MHPHISHPIVSSAFQYIALFIGAFFFFLSLLILILALIMLTAGALKHLGIASYGRARRLYSAAVTTLVTARAAGRSWRLDRRVRAAVGWPQTPAERAAGRCCCGEDEP